MRMIFRPWPVAVSFAVLLAWLGFVSYISLDTNAVVDEQVGVCAEKPDSAACQARLLEQELAQSPEVNCVSFLEAGYRCPRRVEPSRHGTGADRAGAGAERGAADGGLGAVPADRVERSDEAVDVQPHGPAGGDQPPGQPADPPDDLQPDDPGGDDPPTGGSDPDGEAPGVQVPQDIGDVAGEALEGGVCVGRFNCVVIP